MDLFRKKSREADVAMKEDQDDNASIPREVKTKDFRRSSSRSLGKWLGGSSTKKVNKNNNNNQKKSDKEKSSSPEQIHYSSSSGSTSSPRDARDDRPQVFRPTTRKPKAEVKMNRQKEDNDQANSLRGLPPPAAQAAFDGPPRFDWIDIVSSTLTVRSFSWIISHTCRVSSILQKKFSHVC